jgi:Flp pilus assembly protein TadB
MLNGLESRTYERFLRLPVAVVVAVLWLVGAVLAGMSVLVLYLGGCSWFRRWRGERRMCDR